MKFTRLSNTHMADLACRALRGGTCGSSTPGPVSRHVSEAQPARVYRMPCAQSTRHAAHASWQGTQGGIKSVSTPWLAGSCARPLVGLLEPLALSAGTSPKPDLAGLRDLHRPHPPPLLALPVAWGSSCTVADSWLDACMHLHLRWSSRLVFCDVAESGVISVHQAPFAAFRDQGCFASCWEPL